jgi:hypothetical protein
VPAWLTPGRNPSVNLEVLSTAPSQLRLCQIYDVGPDYLVMGTTKQFPSPWLPAELKRAERLARTTNRSLSGVVREGLKRLASERYWQQVQAVARPKAEALGLTEGDVNRQVEDYRRERRSRLLRKETIKKRAK